MKAKKKKREQKFPAYITGAWVMLMFSLFPLVYSDFYFNILETKFTVFCILTGAMVVGMLFWTLGEGEWFHRVKKPGFSPMDWCMLLFFTTSLIATVTAKPYVRQAITGEEGRYVGMLYTALLGAAYFCMRRGFRFRTRYVSVFLWVSWFVCLFGITDFYNMNLLHFRDFMKEEQYRIFVSTIGNINTYTAFVGLVLALSGTLFVFSEESPIRTGFYFVTLHISLMALIMGSSDNGYLTLAAFFAFLPFSAFTNWRFIRRYVMAAALFLSNVLYIRHVMQVKGEEVQYIDGFFQVISAIKFLPLIAFMLWVTGILLFYFEWKSEKEGGETRRAPLFLRKIWILFIFLSVAAFVFFLFRANGMSEKEAAAHYGSMAKYLKFNDTWGTKRGYVWRAAVEEYQKLSIWKKLTGTGPDTFGIYMLINRLKEMEAVTGTVFDAVHNEYLQYLFTIGPLGLLSYIGVMGCGIWSAIRKGSRLIHQADVEKNQKFGAYFYAIGYMIICYVVQAVVNINIPIATPVLWVFVMMLSAEERGEGMPDKN